MASITGPYVLDFTGAQEGFVPVYRDAQPNKIAWEEAPTGGGGATPAGADGQIQFNDGGSDLGASAALVWDATNKILSLGATSAQPVDWYGANSTLALVQGAGASSPAIFVEGAAVTPTVQSFGHRGTVGSPTASVADDHLLDLYFTGANTNGEPTDAAYIGGHAEGIIGATAVPGRLVFSTAAAGGAMTEAFRINSNQSVYALWGLGPVAYFEPNSGVESAINAVDGMLVYAAIPSGPGLSFVQSNGTPASPTATANTDVLGKIEFYGAGTAGTAASVNFGASISARNRSANPDDVQADLEFKTTSSQIELIAKYDGGIVLPHEFANGSDPAAPASGGRLYIVQTGGGKSQLAVRFPSGDPQIVALEP